MSLDISNSSADVPKEIRKDGTGNNLKIAETKGNFFKNIRSQFSFSSLRRSKSSKKALNKVADAKKTAESKSDSEESSLKRTQSFSTGSPIAKTPIISSTLANTPNSETRPRMTSTPVSEEERKAKNKTEYGLGIISTNEGRESGLYEYAGSLGQQRCPRSRIDGSVRQAEI